MAAQNNFFELLGDEETDASAVIERAAAMEKAKKKQQEETLPLQPHDPPKLPSKPLPPAQAVRESKAAQPGGRRGRGGQGREQGGYGNREQGGYGNREQGGYGNKDRDYNGSFNRPSQEGSFQRNRSFDRSDGNRREGNGLESNRGRFYGQGRPVPFLAEDGEGGQQSVEGGRGSGRFYGGGRRQGRGYGGSADSQGTSGAAERQQQRAYVRKDAAGGVQEPKKDKPEGDMIVAEEEKDSVADKQSVADRQPVEQPVEEPKADAGAVEEKKEEDAEDKEMLLDEYYKVLKEKNKHLKSQKADERKVVLDKDLEKMVMVKKQDEGDFVKLGSDKDKGKKKEVLTSKDDKPRKNVSINEFLKPSEGEEYYAPGSRRGRGRGGRGGRGLNEGFRGGVGGSYNMGRQGMAPRIEDPSQFPTLGGAK